MFFVELCFHETSWKTNCSALNFVLFKGCMKTPGIVVQAELLVCSDARSCTGYISVTVTWLQTSIYFDQ